MSSSGTIKKKNLNEREIIDFFYAIEGRFRDDDAKIKKFIDIIKDEGNVK